MQNVPKIVRDRLQAGPLAVNHPDADLLTAFAERSLPDRERMVVLEHLAHCGNCREIVALALPETEPVQTTIRPSPSGWFTWPALRWGIITAGVVAVASLAILQFQRRAQHATTATVLKQQAPVEVAANEPKKEMDRFVAPASANKDAKLHAPATPAFADSVNGAVVADIEKKNEFHGEAARVLAPQAAPVVGRNVGAAIGGPVSHGPRLANQYQQQNNLQNQIPAPAPQAFAKQQSNDLPANGSVPAAPATVEVTSAAPMIDDRGISIDAQQVQNLPKAQTPSGENYVRAKPPTPSADGDTNSQIAQEQALLRLRSHAAPGQIGGYVVDPSGAAVSHARVTITSSKAGKPTTAVTDAQGEWLIAGLPTGSYRAQAAATGFKTTVLDLNYDANQPSAFAFTLSPGSVSETVQVAAATAQVQTDAAKIGSTISSNTITQLPLNGRSFTDLSPVLLPLWSINAAGALQRSLDHGSTWQTVDVNANLVLDAASLQVSAQTSRSKAKDAGKATKRDTAALSFRAVSAAGTEVWAGGSAGALYHSQDAGIHWTRVFPAAGSTGLTGDILTLEFADLQHGKLCTSTSEVWITADAGQTWQKQ
jgi:hypothetical protein